jgi:hypothetical protein
MRPALIFVLAGQTYRKHYALQLFHECLAPRLLFSVGLFEIRRFSKMNLPCELDLLKLAQVMPPQRRHFFVLFQGGECHVEHVEPRRFGTLTEIAALARWLDLRPEVRSVALVSSDTHLRRIKMCCQRLFSQNVRTTLLAVPRSCSDSVARESSATQVMVNDILEFLKVIAYWVLLSPHPRRQRLPK